MCQLRPQGCAVRIGAEETGAPNPHACVDPHPMPQHIPRFRLLNFGIPRCGGLGLALRSTSPSSSSSARDHFADLQVPLSPSSSSSSRVLAQKQGCPIVDSIFESLVLMFLCFLVGYRNSVPARVLATTRFWGRRRGAVHAISAHWLHGTPLPHTPLCDRNRSNIL